MPKTKLQLLNEELKSVEKALLSCRQEFEKCIADRNAIKSKQHLDWSTFKSVTYKRTQNTAQITNVAQFNEEMRISVDELTTKTIEYTQNAIKLQENYTNLLNKKTNLEKEIKTEKEGAREK